MSLPMKTTPLAGACPACGYQFEAISSIGTAATPSPDTISICMGCHVYLVVGPPYRLLSNREWLALDVEHRARLTSVRAALIAGKCGIV